MVEESKEEGYIDMADSEDEWVPEAGRGQTEWVERIEKKMAQDGSARAF